MTEASRLSSKKKTQTNETHSFSKISTENTKKTFTDSRINLSNASLNSSPSLSRRTKVQSKSRLFDYEKKQPLSRRVHNMIEEIYKTNGSVHNGGSYVQLSSHDIALRLIDGGRDDGGHRPKAEVTSITSIAIHHPNQSNTVILRRGSGTCPSRGKVKRSSSKLPSITKVRPESTRSRHGLSSPIVVEPWDSLSRGGSVSSLSGDERDNDIGTLQGSQANLFNRPPVQTSRTDCRKHCKQKKNNSKKKKHKEAKRDCRIAPELHHSGLTMEALNELHAILDDPEYRHEDMIILPVVCGPVCSFNQKARKRLLALELLLKQLPNLKSQIDTGKDPLCAVGGQYLSLSAKNIETLVEMMKTGKNRSDTMMIPESRAPARLIGPQIDDEAAIPRFLKNKTKSLRTGQRSPLAMPLNAD